MAEIEEVKLEQPWYYCSWCEGMVEGELTPIMAKYTEEMSYLDADYFFLSVAEWDKAPLVSVLKCTECDCVVKTPVDPEADTVIIQFQPGDTVWQCQECEAWHLDPKTASECCS